MKCNHLHKDDPLNAVCEDCVGVPRGPFTDKEHAKYFAEIPKIWYGFNIFKEMKGGK